jgi:hypothetical protein
MYVITNRMTREWEGEKEGRIERRKGEREGEKLRGARNI